MTFCDLHSMTGEANTKRIFIPIHDLKIMCPLHLFDYSVGTF
jgi:hypothetical protein